MQHHKGEVTDPGIELHVPVLDVELIPPVPVAFLTAVCTLSHCDLISVSQFHDLLEVVTVSGRV